MGDFRRRLTDIRDRVNASFERILNEGNDTGAIPTVMERLQDFRQEGRTGHRSRRRIRVRQITFKVSLLNPGVTYYRSSRDATAACRIVVALNQDPAQFRRALRSAIPGLEGEFQFCRINGRREVIPLVETCPGEIHRNRALGRSNLYLRKVPDRQLPPSTKLTSDPNSHDTRSTRTELTRESLETSCGPAADGASSDTPAPRTEVHIAEDMGVQGASAPTSDIAMEWELEDTDEEPLQDSPVTAPQLENDLTLQEILESFQTENQEEDKVIVIARRRRVLHSMQMAMARQSFCWKKIPHIEFVGEMADDYGGPKREFLRLLMVELHTSLGLFEGQPVNLFFTYDVEALGKNKYFLTGKLTAWSIFHNGPGPRGLNNNLFKMMCGQRADVPVQVPDLPVDPAVQQNIEKVWTCSTSHQLQQLKEELGDWVASCGMPAIYGAKMDDLSFLRAVIVEHYIFHRLASVVTQYKNGFNSCGGLWQVVERNCMQFLPVFTNTGGKLGRSCLQSLFSIKWSPVGSNRREMEEETIFWWDWWLLAIQDGEINITFEELLVFVSGADAIPPLGFSAEPSLEFYDQEPGERRLPYSSTCSITMFLPRGVECEGDFKELMELSIRGSHGFGKV